MESKELLQADDRKIEYMRFRDIILEGDFFMGQTRLPYLSSDIPQSAKEESGRLRLVSFLVDSITSKVWG